MPADAQSDYNTARDAENGVDSSLLDQTFADHLKECKLVPSGKPYDPNAQVIELKLPLNCYGSMIITPVLAGINQRWDCGWIFKLVFPQILIYIVCLWMQSSFVAYAIKIVLADHDWDNVAGLRDNLCSRDVDVYLQFMCASVSVIGTMKDIIETYDMHAWLMHCPKYDEKVHERILKHVNDEGGETSFPFQKYVCEDDPDQDIEVIKPAVGYTRNFLILIYTTVLLPKLIIAVLLLFFGVGYVLMSDSTENLLLNMVAMHFILDIDELFYEFLTPHKFLMWTESCSAITCHEREYTDMHAYRPYLGIVLICGLSVFSILHFC